MLLDEVNRELAMVEDAPNIFLMDSRPLRVGAYSQDPDVRTGYAKGGFTKGYKLHVLAAKQGQIVAWRLTGLNRNDKPVAWELSDEARPQGLVLADGAYDSAGNPVSEEGLLRCRPGCDVGRVSIDGSRPSSFSTTLDWPSERTPHESSCAFLPGRGRPLECV